MQILITGTINTQMVHNTESIDDAVSINDLENIKTIK